jgi:hypothetical protein
MAAPSIQDTYAELHAECCGLMECIREQLNDAPAPSDETNWSDVANMARLADQLREIVAPQ